MVVQCDSICIIFPGCWAQEEEEEVPAPTVEEDLGAHQEGSRTDSETVER